VKTLVLKMGICRLDGTGPVSDGRYGRGRPGVVTDATRDLRPRVAPNVVRIVKFHVNEY